jgi:hypothetical protein
MPRPSERLDRVQRVHPHQWLWEPLENDPTFVLRSMFGAKAVYLSGQLMLCFCAGEEPWRGVLACTSRGHHDALRAEFPELVPHPILPKWLYLAEATDAFERIATQLVGLARKRDPRLGVTPGASKKKKATRRPRRPVRRGL